METKNNSWFTRLAVRFESARFAAMTFLMTLQSCVGSIAAMFVLKNNDYFSLSLIASVTMASNAVFIAQSPARWCIGTFLTSIIVNTLLLTLSLFI